MSKDKTKNVPKKHQQEEGADKNDTLPATGGELHQIAGKGALCVFLSLFCH